MLRSIFLSIVLLFVTVVLSGCGESPQPQMINGKPAWILNPKYNGKIGAVGVAGRGYDMKLSSQRKLAIQRALDELALQQGVKVELSMTKDEHLENDHNSVVVDSHGTYTTKNNSAISAHIEDIWEDRASGELYVWLVLDN